VRLVKSALGDVPPLIARQWNLCPRVALLTAAAAVAELRVATHSSFAAGAGH